MYKVYLTNIGYYLNNGTPYASLEEAKQAGKKAGFEFSVYDLHNRLVGYWRTFSGWRDYCL